MMSSPHPCHNEWDDCAHEGGPGWGAGAGGSALS